MRRLSLALLFVFFTLPALALDVPTSSDFVTDKAGILSSATREELNTLLKKFEQSDSTQIVVLTILSLESETLEEYGLRVLETWGIGQAGKDNGALLLIAKEERKIRIEVGYGLEGSLTDLVAGRIIDNQITPYFKKGDFDGGVKSGVKAMIKAVRGEYTATASRTKKNEYDPFGFFFLVIMLLLWSKAALSKMKRVREALIGKGYRSSGGFGGGFSGGFSGGRGYRSSGGFSGGSGGGFSGGGGGGGGGGASGGW